MADRLAKLRPAVALRDGVEHRVASSRTSGPRPTSSATTAGSTASRSRSRAQGPRRAGRLLDLHLHQLHPHAAAPRRVGQGVPRRRADDRRRPLARVQLREEGVQRRSARSKQNGIEYPVAQDNELATWNAWSNQYWPAKYLIDANGHVRYAHFGEGDYDKTEAAIRALLARRARRREPSPGPIARYDPAPRRRPRPTSAPSAPSASCRASSRRAPRLHALRRRPAGEPLHARRALEDRRRVRDRRTRRDAARERHGQGRLPRAVGAGHGGRRPSTASPRRRSRSPRSASTTCSLAPTPAAHDLQLRFSPGVAGYAFTFG